MAQPIHSFAGTIMPTRMEDATSLIDVGLENLTDQIDTGVVVIDIMGMDPIAGFGTIGFGGATLCGAPSDTSPGSAGPLIY